MVKKAYHLYCNFKEGLLLLRSCFEALAGENNDNGKQPYFAKNQQYQGGTFELQFITATIETAKGIFHHRS